VFKLRYYVKCRYAQCYCVACCVAVALQDNTTPTIVIINVLIMSVIMVNVCKLIVAMLTVVMVLATRLIVITLWLCNSAECCGANILLFS
jgi:hypothetical protein